MANANTFGSFLKNAPPPVKRQVFLLIAFAALFVGGSVGTILWIWKIHKGPSITESVLESSRKLAMHEDVSFKHSYEIKDMSMAIINKKGTRTAYSQFTLIFDCRDEVCKKHLELNRAKIINAIFEVGGEFHVDDFEAPGAQKGFKRFKESILAKTTEYFGKKGPALVVLKDWVMN